MATYTPSPDNVTFGRGKIMFAPFLTTAAPVQYYHFGNCDTFSIGVAPETVDMTNFMTETSAPYKSVVKKVNIPIKIAGFEFSSFNNKINFMGDQTSYTQAAATITGETLASAAITGLKGSFFRTTKRTISGLIMTQGATTMVSGTDYTVEDASAGVVKILSTGSTIADGTSLLLTYAHAAITGAGLTVVRAAVDTSVEGRLLFLPDNTTGPDNEVLVWNATLRPDGDIGFIGENDFLKWNLTGVVQDDSAGIYGGSTACPYFQVTTR
jgi:hypothetical protein